MYDRDTFLALLRDEFTESLSPFLDKTLRDVKEHKLYWLWHVDNNCLKVVNKIMIVAIARAAY